MRRDKKQSNPLVVEPKVTTEITQSRDSYNYFHISFVLNTYVFLPFPCSLQAAVLYGVTTSPWLHTQPTLHSFNCTKFTVLVNVYDELRGSAQKTLI
jgi:hypothetical protein